MRCGRQLDVLRLPAGLGRFALCAQLQIIPTMLQCFKPLSCPALLPHQVVRASAADTTPMVVQLIPLVVGKLNVSGCKGSRSAGRGREQAAAAWPGPLPGHAAHRCSPAGADPLPCYPRS